MLIEAQLTAGAQHPPQLRQRVRLVRHRAEDQAGDGGVERGIGGGQVVGDTADDLDPDFRVGGGRARTFAQIRLRFHGNDLIDRRGVVGEIAARPGADLDHAA